MQTFAIACRIWVNVLSFYSTLMFVKDPVDEIIIYDFRNAVYPCCVTLTSK